MEKTTEKVSWKAKWRIDKFKDPENAIAKALRAGLTMTEVLRLFGGAYLGTEEWENNLALNVGLQNLINIICGIGSTTLYNNANARLGVGSDATAASAAQTDLLGALPTWKAMGATER